MPRPPTTPPGNVAASGLLPARSPSERKVDERTGHDVLAEHATKAKREVSPRDPLPPPFLSRLRMRARTHKFAPTISEPARLFIMVHQVLSTGSTPWSPTPPG